MSARSDTAQRIADFINDNDLAQVFGGEVSQSGDKRYYSILCSLPRILDGFIRVYSEKFILIQLAGPLAHGEYSAVYTSEADAVAFLQALLVDHDEDAAYAIPTKPTKGPA